MNTANAKEKPSRKARVRALYLEQGAEEAFTFGRKLKLKESTLHSWIGFWRREAAKAKAAKVHARTAKRKANVQAAPVEAPVEPAPTTTTEVQP
jgi:hypothetical protein